MRIRLAVCIALAIAVLAGLPAFAAADPCAGNPVSTSFGQSFPSAGPPVTRWEGTVCSVGKYGLALGITRFRTSPSATFVRMLQDARVSEIYVSYHDGLSFFDIEGFSSGLLTLNTTDCPPALGTLVLGNLACLEVRDRGLAYRTGSASRRGEELVLWGVNVSANYKYVIEWRLRDDGVITGRLGATGENLASHHDIPHVHLVTWRLDLDVAGSSGDTVRESTHVESSSDVTSHDTFRVVGVEGGRAWSATGFRYWHISDGTRRNAQGHLTALRLIPSRQGIARLGHLYTLSDLWVTRGGPGKEAQTVAQQLPAYVNGEAVTGANVVVWYSTPIHHVPRDEDDLGATQLMWAEFSLVPENLFNASPLP